MAWKSLKHLLNDKPRVLAGPILRKVTATSVTVWIAMRIGATVALSVQDEKDVQVMGGERRSVAIGKNLHIVAVTASMMPPFENITEGIVYRYNLSFKFDDNSHGDLAVATDNAVLSYPPWTLPSFALPPKDLNLLRLIQGSCRMPHAKGLDMMPSVGPLIEQSASNAYARPHQLLLTGDQIYADDVAYPLSLLLSDASEALLEWTEQYESRLVPQKPRPVTDLHPLAREQLLWRAGFTTVDLPGHLMGLGEYLAMYLFVWSDVLWPSKTVTVPAAEELETEFLSRWSRMAEAPWPNLAVPYLEMSVREKIQSQRFSLMKFRDGLPEIRRVLANIPSYMIFDDHEVTDDWNMTRGFCNGVYGNELGLRVVQNALVAYSLCQHWGNVPEDFLPASLVQLPRPGTSLLALLDTPQPTAANAFQQKAAEYDRKSPDIRKLVAVHDAAMVRARQDHAVFHGSHSLQYHYTVEGPSHQIIFTDTRTWRSFPKNTDGTHLLSKTPQTDQYKEQILDAPDTGNRLLFVVLSTNMPPVQPIRAATRHARISNKIKHHPDIYEAWELPSVAFDRLLVALTSKLPLDASNQHMGPVIVLSGDVHFSFASRIMYRATKRYEDDAQPRGAMAVIAQLVCSGFKKQDEDTIRFHRVGYYAAPTPWVADRLIRHTLQEGYVGWNFPKGAKTPVCNVQLGAMRMPLIIDKQTIDVSDTKEQLASEFNSRAVDLVEPAHYRYRFDYLLPTKQLSPTSPPTMPPLPAGASPETRKAVAQAYFEAIKTYRTHNQINPPKVVGRNNFGEIRLDWGAVESRKVHYNVRWQDPGDAAIKMTTYSVRLDLNKPDDKEFPDIKARVEP